MFNVSEEEAAERWGHLPEKILDALFSEQNSNLIDNLGIKYSLSTEVVESISTVVRNVLYGFIRLADAPTELATATELDADTISKMYPEIKAGVFDPLEPELSSVYQPPSSEGPTPTAPTTSAAASQMPQNPLLNTAPSPKPQQGQAPFILHQREGEEMEPRVEDVLTHTSPIRPVFYKAPNNAAPESEVESYKYEPVKARLELGIQQEKQRTEELATLKTKTEGLRHVNYSGLKTNLNDPFAARVDPVPEPSENGVKNASGDNNSNASLRDLPL
ncbi:MAG: hypothetical protein M1361_00695 [Patescibacteria group bacterium]|nr:hypothetical protein [Patescibacteria group bacterium]MCL5224129.1 hypothetical protein [Patescibacteria group bacterium]